jgi:hypothetical protein
MFFPRAAINMRVGVWREVIILPILEDKWYMMKFFMSQTFFKSLCFVIGAFNGPLLGLFPLHYNYAKTSIDLDLSTCMY